MEHSNHNLNSDSVKSSWVNEKLFPEGKLDLHVEEISRTGYSIQKNNKLNPEEINYVIKKIDEDGSLAKTRWLMEQRNIR